MEVTFWGVRGSIPCCGEDYHKTGGNSSCVGVRLDDKIIIFDAGTGIRELGLWLEQHPHIREAHLFMSHFHYDHVIGFPFFAPLWKKGFKVVVYATVLEAYGGVEHFFKTRILSPPFFPITLSHLCCDLEFKDLQNGDEVRLDDHTRIQVGALNHPGGASGYRLESHGKSCCYVSDTEHQKGQLDAQILELIQNADLVIYDASFTDEEYDHHVGWGHSTWQEGMKLCQAASAKRMAIYHHDPSHTDDVMAILEKEAHQTWEGLFVARQGMKVIL